MTTFTCPVDGPFTAEPEVRVSQSAHDVPIVDARGQHPTMAGQMNASGVPLLEEQREILAAQPNPAWTPTYERVVLDDPVEHEVAVCPSCGSPIKVG